uniref:NADH dehydrogenase subunit 6 n=1 Tax=Cacopsylla melanoneura TaxID=428564 RepID=A0A8D8TUU7_9HEMI
MCIPCSLLCLSLLSPLSLPLSLFPSPIISIPLPFIPREIFSATSVLCITSCKVLCLISHSILYFLPPLISSFFSSCTSSAASICSSFLSLSISLNLKCNATFASSYLILSPLVSALAKDVIPGYPIPLIRIIIVNFLM